MSLAEKEDIREFADKVRNALGDRIQEILLFGSYARDEHVPGSDVDVAIIVTEKKDGDEDKIWEIAGDYLMRDEIHFMPKIIEKDHFENKVKDGFRFYKNVREEGVTI